MTARKPTPRKASPTLPQRVSDLERLADWNSDCITVLRNELETLQTRKQFRDASHDVPVSNAGNTSSFYNALACDIPPQPSGQQVTIHRTVRRSWIWKLLGAK